MAEPVTTRPDLEPPPLNAGIDTDGGRQPNSLHRQITFESPQAPGDSDAFQELRRRIRREGLLDRQTGYYAFKVVSALVLLGQASPSWPPSTIWEFSF